jgi:uncharacterized protein YegL
VSLEDRIEIANPQHPHCPTVLVLDVSGSMNGDKIRQLNQGIEYFKEDVGSDDLARKRVDVGIVSFGSDVRVAHDFSSVETLDPPNLKAHGSTPMGKAILTAVDLVRKRKQEYKQKGTDYYRPWIFLVTDGEPTDMKPGDELWSQVVETVHSGERSKDFLFFSVGVEPADMELLRRLSPPERPPVGLRRGQFKEMFAWLSRSQQRVSASRVGDQVALEDPSGPKGWAEIATT